MTRTRRLRYDDSGSVAWALLVALALLALGVAYATSVIVAAQKSKAATDQTMLVQYTDTAVSDAVSTLNAGDTLPATRHDAIDAGPKCDLVQHRHMCYLAWALPTPATAVDPVRYDLVTHVWIDTGDRTEPADGRNLRATKLPLEVITYQTAPGVEPTLEDGYVTYNPTPAGLFANALFSFESTTLEGPGLHVRSYNSQTGETGTANATVSSSGWVSYGTTVQADRTVLFNGAAGAGDHTSRCTGEACVESDVRVITSSFSTPDDASVQWVRDLAATTCNAVIDGDWVASEHAGVLPAGTTCVNGSLVIDTPTTTASPLTTLYVFGIVDIRDSLNAPNTGLLAAPASLVLYSTGSAVTFDAPDGAGVAAMLYAPLAACGNNPASTDELNYFGSLVCDTVSLAGQWNHMFDEGAAAQYIDPVPGAARTFAPGVTSLIQPDEFTVPSGWDSVTCVVAPPAGAVGYWKLDELGGVLARDSSGAGLDAGWVDRSTARPAGVCGRGAPDGAAGAVLGTRSVTSTSGLTIEYWARGQSGTPVTVAGVSVTHDDTSHVTVTAGATAARIPFTVQNHDNWHLYTVTISPAGAVTLYVEGLAKGTGTTARPDTVSGPVKLATGTAGRVDEVVYYQTPLTATAVADRYTWWQDHLDAGVTTTPAGTPFTAPTGVVDNGTVPTSLRIRWAVPSGTFPTTDPTTGYTIQVASSASGTFSDLGTAAGTATSWSQTNPDFGSKWYRVCATYNGDTRCSSSVNIVTLVAPDAPVLSGSALSTTQARFTWNTPTWTESYEVQYQYNDGSWSSLYPVSLATKVSTRTLTQGTRIAMRVRAINEAGTGPWSNTATVQLGIDTPTYGAMTAWSSMPRLYSRVDGVSCPSGTAIQSRQQDRWEFENWPGFGSYVTSNSSTSSATYYASTTSYDHDLDVSIRLRCINTSSGQVSGETGSIVVYNIQHPMPSPGGFVVHVGGSGDYWRAVDWTGTSCASGTYLRSSIYVKASFTYSASNVTWTRYSNTGTGWGSGYTTVTTWCITSGGRTGPTRSITAGF